MSGSWIPLARPTLGEAELAASERVLRSGRLVTGPENQAFEAALTAVTGRRHAIAVASGTAALELALWGLGVAPGDEVLIPAFGFVAAANAVARLGGTPVPVDVDAATWNVDIASLRANATPRSRAIVSIDQLGLMAESGPLEAAAAELGIPLIEDAACGLGSRDSAGVAGGGCGVAATLSFHPRKVVTTGEGGAIVCDDDELAERLRQLRNHGQVAAGEFVRVGTNARMSEAAAAIGSAQLARLDRLLAERRLLATGYLERLASTAGADRISWQVPPGAAFHTYQTFAVLLGEGLSREQIQRHLAERAIEAGPTTYAFHLVGCHRRPVADDQLPRATALHQRGLALPLYIGMRSGELDRVCDALAEVLL